MIVRKLKELINGKNDLLVILEKLIDQKDRTIRSMQDRIDYLEKNQKCEHDD